MGKILIDSVYINQSGGKVLLDILLQSIIDSDYEKIFLLADQRVQGFLSQDIIDKLDIKYIPASERCRKRFYISTKESYQKVFCFGNIPPPIKLSCKVITYIHNILLVSKNSRIHLPYKTRLLFWFKQIYLNRILLHTDEIVVQTSHMASLIRPMIGSLDIKVYVIPFYDVTAFDKSFVFRENNKFIYPATGYAYKNHRLLLNAWYELKRKHNISLQLNITIDTTLFPKLSKKISKAISDGINIVNHGIVSKNELNDLYKECEYCIHPSDTESFGLVLIEALNFNCKLLASNRDYVSSVVIPNYSFANNVESIVKTVLMAIERRDVRDSKILISDERYKLVNYILQ